MKKSIKILFGGVASLFTLIAITSCNKTSNEEGNYETKEVDFYREKDKVDRKIALRFYSETPSVPYVGVKQYFKEFYATEVVVEQDDYNFKFKKDDAYLKLDTKDETLSILDIDTLGHHPEFKSSNSTIFLKQDTIKTTTAVPKIVDLNNYSISAYKSDGDAYVPFSLISNIVTGTQLFTIVYNEKDLYEFDYQGELGPERMEEYYGDSFKAPMKENTKRKPDMINFSYNLICLLIDNFRGYTSQMTFIDNNVLSLGLNGTLEKYYPEIKKNLLSDDRTTYMAGAAALFFGLNDGGHTALMTKLQSEMFPKDNPITNYYADDSAVLSIAQDYLLTALLKQYNQLNMLTLKKTAFGLTDINFYYKFDDAKKLAYLGFDKFEVNYDGWDDYYKQKADGQAGIIPTNDTYAYVRGQLYQALADGAETVILDLSTNGGGDSAALIGIVGLLNSAKGTMSMNDIANHYRIDDNNLVDINLDGKYDEKDVEEANKFKQMNIVLLTSSYAFSCGNLLPSLLKELGYKTIGEKTGGGSCAIMLGAMADGLFYIRSSYKCLSDAAGHNIDSGVVVDVDLMGEPMATEIGNIGNYSNFYNIEYVSNVVKKLFE